MKPGMIYRLTQGPGPDEVARVVARASLEALYERLAAHFRSVKGGLDLVAIGCVAWIAVALLTAPPDPEPHPKAYLGASVVLSSLEARARGPVVEEGRGAHFFWRRQCYGVWPLVVVHADGTREQPRHWLFFVTQEGRGTWTLVVDHEDSLPLELADGSIAFVGSDGCGQLVVVR